MNNLGTSAASGVGGGGGSILPWTLLPLLNGWAQYGAPYASGSYTKDSLGVVHLKGLLNPGGRGADIIGVLPVGFRPLVGSRWFTGVSEGAGGTDIQIDPDGTITAFNVGGGFVSLDVISFAP